MTLPSNATAVDSPSMATTTRSPTATISPRDRNRLRSLTRAIRLGQRAQEDRASLMIALRNQGLTLDAIAEASSLTREQVRKSVLRRTTGYKPDGRPPEGA